jgi:hypothetical protein
LPPHHSGARPPYAATRLQNFSCVRQIQQIGFWYSPYVDNRPLATAGKPETRKYKAVFFLGKSEIGLESDVAEATARP